MDKLMVVRGIGKGVHSLLGDLHPSTHTDLGANQTPKILEYVFHNLILS
jgi:hypothetical protein